jgi:hypothetical protein
VTTTFTDVPPHWAVAHEGGHFFGAKTGGASWDGKHHCANKACLMVKSLEAVTVRKQIEHGGTLGWLERKKLWEPSYETVSKSQAESFCDECAATIDETARAMQRGKTATS